MPVTKAVNYSNKASVLSKKLKYTKGIGAFYVLHSLIEQYNKHYERTYSYAIAALCVFPLQLPALREWKDDIGILAQHFISKFCEKLNRNELHLSSESLKSLLYYNWPGNIRELENLIERSVILTKGDHINIITLPIAASLDDDHIDEDFIQHKTIEENERAHILNVLNKCGGRIRGEDGAAKILGVPPTTLASKMLKLGIKRNHF